MDLNLVSGISTWSPVALQHKDINTSLCCSAVRGYLGSSTFQGHLLASGGSAGHSHRRGFRHRPQPSTRTSVVTRAMDIHRNLGLQHSLTGAGTKDTKVTSRLSTNPRGLLMRSNPDNETSSLSEVLSLLRTRAILSMFRG